MYILICTFVFMKVSSELAKYISYLSGLNIEPGDISKDILLGHEFAKKLFGEKSSSGMYGGQPDWHDALRKMVLYTDEEMTKFLINLYEYESMVNKFKEVGIDFTGDRRPLPDSGGDIYCYKKDNYDYFVTLYNYLTSIGFKLDRVYVRSIFEGEYSIYISNDQLDISIKLENNPFHANWWTIYMSGQHIPLESKSFRNGYKCPEDLKSTVDKYITDTIKNSFESGNKKQNRDFKSYMLLNNIEKFDAVEYMKYIINETELA